MPIAPMIDCVFLLLIYFMVSTTMAKQEADIRFLLPGVAPLEESLEMPDEQIIEIFADGRIVVNEYEYDLYNLRAMLSRFRETCMANKVESRILIAPADDVTHKKIVQVMDACALAGIENMNFSFGEE